MFEKTDFFVNYNGTRRGVELDQGVVIGVENELPNGSEYFQFLGIPYAEPPINKLRFAVNTFPHILLLFFILIWSLYLFIYSRFRIQLHTQLKTGSHQSHY